MASHARRQPQTLDPELHLHVCGTCASELVHPLSWERVGRRFWRIELRCPECWWEGAGVFDDELAERLETHMELATDELLRELELISAANGDDEL